MLFVICVLCSPFLQAFFPFPLCFPLSPFPIAFPFPFPFLFPLPFPHPLPFPLHLNEKEFCAATYILINIFSISYLCSLSYHSPASLSPSPSSTLSISIPFPLLDPFPFPPSPSSFPSSSLSLPYPLPLPLLLILLSLAFFLFFFCFFPVYYSFFLISWGTLFNKLFSAEVCVAETICYWLMIFVLLKSNWEAIWWNIIQTGKIIKNNNWRCIYYKAPSVCGKFIVK